MKNSEGFYAIMFMFAFFCLGMYAGATITENTLGNRCEQVVIDSIANGKEFMFYQNRPVVIMSTLRSDKSVKYRASLGER